VRPPRGGAQRRAETTAQEDEAQCGGTQPRSLGGFPLAGRVDKSRETRHQGMHQRECSKVRRVGQRETIIGKSRLSARRSCWGSRRKSMSFRDKLAKNKIRVVYYEKRRVSSCYITPARVPIIPLPGTTPPQLRLDSRRTWYRIIRKDLCYRNQFCPMSCSCRFSCRMRK
jgi:hypothetical protein